MIDRQDIIASFRTELAEGVSTYTPPPLSPLAVSPWVAMSLLQKSVRRGGTEWALSAAATLLLNDPDRLWRRLGGIAFEDVGLGDLSTVGVVSAAVAGKRVRSVIATEWAIAAHLTERLTASRKCRAADDLLMTAELTPAFEGFRHEMAEMSDHRLRLIALTAETIQETALAVLYLAGTDRRPQSALRPRHGTAAIAFHVLDELGVPLTLLEVAREGYRRSGDSLCLMLPLVAIQDPGQETCMTNDRVPPEEMAGPVPGWALDAYTREGKTAIRRLLASDPQYRRGPMAGVDPRSQPLAYARALFHVEGGVLKGRRRSDVADDLRRLNETDCLGVPSDRAADLIAAVADSIPNLNGIRAEMMGGRHA